MTSGLSSRTKLIGSNIFALTLCFLLGAETASFAVDHPRETGQDILSESMNALLTGKEGGKALKQKQQALREALKTGEISKTELVAMLQKSILPILEPTFLEMVAEIVNPVFFSFKPVIALIIGRTINL